jgi:integrase
MSQSRKKNRSPKRVLGFPDLEHSKTAVLNSLTSKSGQRSYDRAITDFVEWYNSEPRLAFNRTVVLRYRIHLEQKLYAPTTINLRLAAVRRVAYEAADSGLLSPELAAGIRRVKGVRRIGVRVGNWLTAEQGRRLLSSANRDSLRGKRNYAILAMLIGCGLRRGELLGLHAESIQLREEHWVIADILGMAGDIRTVPVPPWVMGASSRGLAQSRENSAQEFGCTHRITANASSPPVPKIDASARMGPQPGWYSRNGVIVENQKRSRLIW